MIAGGTGEPATGRPHRPGAPPVTPDDARDRELLRLRDKQHELEKQQWGTGALARELGRGLGELRDSVRGLRDDLAALEERVEGMTTADKIAAGVAQGIAHERRARWTLARKLVAAGAGTLLLVPALHDLIAWLGG